ncbi:MAG: VacJ family lipoprotein [Polaromonas sp.]|uniref:MlaA family lipoprotein n=1 Tax=Polaromonas sp. TaxID=1869339 RepID=UPI0027318796|nr:VacJ family lipoprotein [Polaromonas sp.]MDP2257076.1 VacJ family lipoprotein [Polaromonas sp.]
MTTPLATKKSLGWASAALVLALLQGCATGPNANPADPLEPLNRTVFKFNDGLDRAVIKPVATAYQNVTPALVRTGVTNFFGNISDVWSVVNNVLQAKPQAAAESFFRVTINTLWGLGGIFDVASEMKIPKHSENFGQTLGHWGVASGPYLVLPVFGPSNVRDSVGRLVDSQGDLVTQGVDNISVRNSLVGLRLVNLRANLLGVEDFLEQASLDKYTFARDIYMQRHRSSRAVDAPAEERYDLPEEAPGAEQPTVPVPASN